MKKFSTTLKNEEINSIAIGGFDGLHIAHQELISHLGPNGAILVIDKDSASLTPNSHRCKYIKQGCFFLKFEDIKDMSGEDFIIYLKKYFINLKKIVVGYDFRFGHMAKADVDDLKRLYEGEVVIVKEVFFDGISVHSRLIREELTLGNIKTANRLLGRNYEIIGNVIKGQGLGSKKLFPTINLRCKEFLIPKDGVYATITKIGEKSYPSATFIGQRVSTDGNYSIETHILDEDIENLPKEISISFIDFIRDNRKFKSLETLKKQIKEDLTYAKQFLKEML